jgi:hypothetical protein
MVDHPNSGKRACELVGDLPGVVGAAVVDDQDFEVRRERLGDLPGCDDQAGNRAGVVVCGKKDAGPGIVMSACSKSMTLALCRLPNNRQLFDRSSAEP